ncbi:MAG: His/Gly/Thr/Pro-type tRNA ligase C-terminal domain-containing protein, partial [Bacilli bacterium]|nr:His/Gly/Thr/Pro-type tRNA ligase C-terminal domain-containing protein [Bacilli bacterium]
LEHSKQLKDILLENNIRVELDSRDEKLSYRMRESQVQKIPYSLIIGDKEIENNQISYRRYGNDETITIKLEEFIDLLKNQIDNRK